MAAELCLSRRWDGAQCVLNKHEGNDHGWAWGIHLPLNWDSKALEQVKHATVTAAVLGTGILMLEEDGKGNVTVKSVDPATVVIRS